MKKNILKKIFIKVSKLLGFEIIDQNEFYSPTLGKNLDDNLYDDKKSIVLPLGEVKITRQIESLLVIFRTNTNVQIWDQNRKRIFEKPKIEYVQRALNSLIKSLEFLSELRQNLKIKLILVDDNSTKENLDKIKKILSLTKIENELINHKSLDHKNTIKEQSNNETFSNLSSLLRCYEIAKDKSKDIIYFVEDDYLHFNSALEEMISSYERISSQMNRDIFICPADYPYLYMNNDKTNILIGSRRHWRTISKTLCTFLVSKKLFDKYWEKFFNTCVDRNDPFEKYINEIYENEICISPIKSLSVHMTNINSNYGLSPFINYKSLWDENKVND